MLALAAWARAEGLRPETAPVELVYIAANEGGSSGGHVALRVGERAYHYQAGADGRLRLNRDPWPVFLAHYNLLGNRSLERARLALDTGHAAAAAEWLDRLHVIERRHRAVSRALAFERRVLEARAADAREVAVWGGGLFAGSLRPAGPRDHPHGLRLLAAVERVLGRGAVERLRAAPSPPLGGPTAPLPALELARDRYPVLPPLAGERMRERLQGAAALDALARARPLSPDVLIDAGGPPLSPDERRGLLHRAQRLEERVVALLGSRRPDRGMALLVAVARHRAIQASLDAGRLHTLDPFASPPLAAGDGGLRMSPGPLARLGADLERALEALRARSLAGEAVEEWSQRLLENASARSHEVTRSLAEGTPLRTGDRRLVPSRVGALPLERLGLDAPDADALRRARENERRFARALARAYDYDLIARNCATELAPALGVEIGPGSFVPALFFDDVARSLPVDGRFALASYRLRRLEALRGTAHPLWLRLREGNVLSSTLYEAAPRDSTFLLFTDDVLWARPLYGTLNVGYAALHASAGVLRAPLDGGASLVRGVRGVLFSLPELAFVNVRKGSYEYLPRLAELWSGADLEPAPREPASGGTTGPDREVDSR